MQSGLHARIAAAKASRNAVGSSSALDADVLIYNSTIDGGITSIDELLAKSPLFADFKAVQTGNVWCITKNFYQESLALGDMILDVHAVLNNPDAADLRFLKKLS